jgi:molybdopterin molybdotransferase
MSLISVAAAEEIILGHKGTYGAESVLLSAAPGRVLTQDIVADRNLPPFNRVTMDGISIDYSAYEAGVRDFTIAATIAAGATPIEINEAGECIELMTGCALPATTDTVIRYEDLKIANGVASVLIEGIRRGANVHREGSDVQAGAVVVPAHTVVDAAVVSMAASVGCSALLVQRLPRVVIITTGDELIAVDALPNPFQVRRSNSYAIQAALLQYGIDADTLHISDNVGDAATQIGQCLAGYDAIVLTGGVSMGKFDIVPGVMQELGVQMCFHKVKQRPGKPFWFGAHKTTNTVVFAFPGNPVSAFLCLHRYLIPWVKCTIEMPQQGTPLAALTEDVIFQPELQYFLQVVVSQDAAGKLIAKPLAGNGSGDFSNLLHANAFLELPAGRTHFSQGELFSIWPFKPII